MFEFILQNVENIGENQIVVESICCFLVVMLATVLMASVCFLVVILLFGFLDPKISRSSSTASSVTGGGSVSDLNFDVIDPNFQDSAEFVPYDWDVLLEDAVANGDEHTKSVVSKMHRHLRALTEDIENTVNLPDEMWSLKQDSRGVRVKSAKVDKSKPAVFKIETIFDAPPALMLRAIGVVERRREWDTEIQMTNLEAFNNTLVVRRTLTGSLAGGAISSRDFIDLVGLSSDGENFRFVSSCYKDSTYPDQKGAVRGTNYGSGVWLEPTMERFDPANNAKLGDRPSTKYRAVVQVDINLWLAPTSLIDLAMTSNVDASIPPLRNWVKNNT